MDSTASGAGNRPHKKSDELLKGVFEENFPDFLRFMYPDADSLFDFDKGITFMDKELLEIIPDRERKKGGRVADLLVKVYLNDGNEKWILVHTEIEGRGKDDFAFRMLQYHYRLLDRYRVAVESIAVFTGDRNQRRPNEYRREGISNIHYFRYLSYHIFDHSESELLSMDNIFAYVVVACQKALLEGKVPDEELAEDRSTIARTLIATGRYDKERIISFVVFLKSFIFIGNREINIEFDSYIYQVTGGTIDMGVIEIVKRQERQQGLQQGRLEERARAHAEQLAKQRSFVRNLINQTEFSDEEIAGIAEVSITVVQDVRNELNKK